MGEMFDKVSRRYDLLNRILSFGVDRYWRGKAVGVLRGVNPRLVLDVGTGTADIAILLASRRGSQRIVGVDVSKEMLKVGRSKIRQRGFEDRIELREGDGMDLDFHDDFFDAVIIGFGIRNFQDHIRGLTEMRRVLKPGGLLVVLEFSKPGNAFISLLYRFYSSRILPLIGRLLSSHPEAYSYLPESVQNFPSGPAFMRSLAGVGFRSIRQKPLTFGICSVYHCIK